VKYHPDKWNPDKDFTKEEGEELFKKIINCNENLTYD
jgi:hypothetical protein